MCDTKNTGTARSSSEVRQPEGLPASQSRYWNITLDSSMLAWSYAPGPGDAWPVPSASACWREMNTCQAMQGTPDGETGSVNSWSSWSRKAQACIPSASVPCCSSSSHSGAASFSLRACTRLGAGLARGRAKLDVRCAAPKVGENVRAAPQVVEPRARGLQAAQGLKHESNVEVQPGGPHLVTASLPPSAWSWLHPVCLPAASPSPVCPAPPSPPGAHGSGR